MNKKWKYMGWVIVFLFISSITVDWKMYESNLLDYNPLSLGNIISGFTRFLVFTLLGLSMIFNYEAMLKWIENYFRLSLPAGGFRLLGCFLSCVSLFMLILSANDFLAYLGIVPNPYAP